MKTTKQFLTLALAAAFLTAGFSAGASLEDLDPPAQLPLAQTIHEFLPADDPTVVNEWQADIQDSTWAMPFWWDPAEVEGPIGGASWWTGINLYGSSGNRLGADGYNPAQIFEHFELGFYTNDSSSNVPDSLLATRTLEADLTSGNEEHDFGWEDATATDITGTEGQAFRIGGKFGNVDPGTQGWYWMSVSASTYTRGTIPTGAYAWDSVEDGKDQARWLSAGDASNTDNIQLPSASVGTDEYFNVTESQSPFGTQEVPSNLAGSIHVVPEPASMTLLGIGLAGFATRRFMSRKKKA